VRQGTRVTAVGDTAAQQPTADLLVAKHVVWHLRNIYRKIEVESREELTRRFND
jgi:ATP/maltotriose-dependent transcriptional regulator MalT